MASPDANINLYIKHYKRYTKNHAAQSLLTLSLKNHPKNPITYVASPDAKTNLYTNYHIRYTKNQAAQSLLTLSLKNHPRNQIESVASPDANTNLYTNYHIPRYLSKDDSFKTSITGLSAI